MKMTRNGSRDSFGLPEESGTLVLQLALPPYRQGLIDEFANDDSIIFATGDSQFQSGVTVGVEGEHVFQLPPNRFIFGRRLAIQHIGWKSVMSAGTLVIELNPRIINSWVYLIARRISGRRTIAWGHVFPRAGRYAKTERLRKVMRSLLDGMIVYTESEAHDFGILHPRIPVYVATNALYSKAELGAKPTSALGQHFIMIGRLVESKKPGLVLDAFRLLLETAPDARLKVVGTGPLEPQVRANAQDLIESGLVSFEGEVTDLKRLRPLFHSSVALVCGGYVGLNVTQAIGFGVPVIYVNGEPHAPEAEMLSPQNSLRVEPDAPSALAAAMNEVWRHRIDWAAKGRELSESVVCRYTTEGMADGFREAVKGGRE